MALISAHEHEHYLQYYFESSIFGHFDFLDFAVVFRLHTLLKTQSDPYHRYLEGIGRSTYESFVTLTLVSIL